MHVLPIAAPVRIRRNIHERTLPITVQLVASAGRTVAVRIRRHIQKRTLPITMQLVASAGRTVAVRIP